MPRLVSLEETLDKIAQLKLADQAGREDAQLVACMNMAKTAGRIIAQSELYDGNDLQEKLAEAEELEKFAAWLRAEGYDEEFIKEAISFAPVKQLATNVAGRVGSFFSGLGRRAANPALAKAIKPGPVGSLAPPKPVYEPLRQAAPAAPGAIGPNLGPAAAKPAAAPGKPTTMFANSRAAKESEEAIKRSVPGPKPVTEAEGLARTGKLEGPPKPAGETASRGPVATQRESRAFENMGSKPPAGQVTPAAQPPGQAAPAGQVAAPAAQPAQAAAPTGQVASPEAAASAGQVATPAKTEAGQLAIRQREANKAFTPEAKRVREAKGAAYLQGPEALQKATELRMSLSEGRTISKGERNFLKGFEQAERAPAAQNAYDKLVQQHKGQLTTADIEKYRAQAQTEAAGAGQAASGGAAAGKVQSPGWFGSGLKGAVLPAALIGGSLYAGHQALTRGVPWAARQLEGSSSIPMAYGGGWSPVAYGYGSTPYGGGMPGMGPGA
jgi:hypothetical protein